MKKKSGKKAETPKSRERRMTLTPEEFILFKELRETGVIPDEYLIRSDISFTKLKDRSTETKRRYESLLQEIQEKDETIEHLLALKEGGTGKKPDLSKMKKSKGTVGNATAVMVASDWHIEEQVDPSTVNGKNEYNLSIAEERAANFFRKGVFLTDLVRNGIRIDNLILAFLGDLISGYIHEELQEDNYLSPTEASLFVQDIICSGIDYLIKEGNFKQIVIPCCIGNHGRTTQKKRIATAYKNSYEWMMYKTLEKIYRNNEKVHFIVENGYHTYVNLYGKYNLRFHHGDAMRYGGGVGGITIPVNKAIAQWNKTEEAYLDVFGHFHQQMMDAGPYVCNGSLIGWNAFAVAIKAGYDDPKQSFFVIDQEKGKICDWPIFVK
jgi:hypothetical protein